MILQSSWKEKMTSKGNTLPIIGSFDTIHDSWKLFFPSSQFECGDPLTHRLSSTKVKIFVANKKKKKLRGCKYPSEKADENIRKEQSGMWNICNARYDGIPSSSWLAALCLFPAKLSRAARIFRAGISRAYNVNFAALANRSRTVITKTESDGARKVPELSSDSR